jgi:hypothetical protein
VLWLVPALGERNAELLETPVMLGIIFATASYLVRGPGRSLGGRGLAACGLLALALLLAVELTVVLKLRGLSFGDYVAGRDPVAGTVYVLSLVLFAAAPWLLARRIDRR